MGEGTAFGEAGKTENDMHEWGRRIGDRLTRFDKHKRTAQAQRVELYRLRRVRDGLATLDRGGVGSECKGDGCTGRVGGGGVAGRRVCRS